MSLSFIFFIILFGFLSGQAIRYIAPNKIDRVRDIAVYSSLRIAIPISIIGSIWVLNIDIDSLTKLPIIGACVLLSGLVIGIFIARIQKLSRIQTGVVAPAAAYTNIGGVGAFVVYSFLGEQGFALVPLYKLFEELIYFGILFPFAAKHSQETTIVSKRWWNDPVIQIMLAALTLGFLLNLFNIPRPNMIQELLNYTIPFGAFSMMLATGILFQLTNIKPNIVTALPISLLKPIILLLTAVLAINLLDIESSPNADIIIGVSVILAIMPTAFLASIPASLYKLDIDLANTIWLLSTGLFFITLPFIPYLIKLNFNF